MFRTGAGGAGGASELCWRPAATYEENFSRWHACSPGDAVRLLLDFQAGGAFRVPCCPPNQAGGHAVKRCSVLQLAVGLFHYQ